jgi:hypothetical protein
MPALFQGIGRPPNDLLHIPAALVWAGKSFSDMELCDHGEVPQQEFSSARLLLLERIMRPLTVDDIREVIPDLDELRSFADQIVAQSHPDPDRR